MENCIIVRYSEIYLKGKNRVFFERMLEENMEKSLKGIKHDIVKQSGRYLVEGYDDDCLNEVIRRLMMVFGIHTLSVSYKVNSNLDDILEAALAVCEQNSSFKVETHRADKKFPLNSVELSAKIGGDILERRSDLSVDVHNPDFIIHIDVRENQTALVFNKLLSGPGGMPVGTAGRGLLLLSGGIDSPVAGHMISKRGMRVDCIHFHSYPYTNLQAKDKVVRLAKVLSGYTGGMTLYIVKVTKIQESIHKCCDGNYMVAILRRFMVRIAQRIAQRSRAQCLITGESLGQVASQTIEGMASTGQATDLPILRPLVGFDKNEIIFRAKAMDTYEISIEPFEDCCTVFLPDHPVIHPRISDVVNEEQKLDVESLIDDAMNDVEIISF